MLGNRTDLVWIRYKFGIIIHTWCVDKYWFRNYQAGELCSRSWVLLRRWTQHINTIAWTCFYHLRWLRQIRWRAGQEVTVWLVLALVVSRTDFCNALFAGLPTSTIAPLQWVQNAAAQLVLQLGLRNHVTQWLRDLHWLPIHARVLYKLCVLMYDVHVGNGNSPFYIRDIVTTCCSATRRSGLCSSLTTDYVKPRLSTKFGERAFFFCHSARLEPATTTPCHFKSCCFSETPQNSLFKFCF